MKTFIRYDGEDDNKQRLNVQALKSHAVQPSLLVPPTSLSLVMLNAANVTSVVRCVWQPHNYTGLGFKSG
jgi:hypothetical protein